MKRIIFTIAIITVLIGPSIGFPFFLIELKSGARFTTEQYWEEGTQIKFYYSGGVVGVEKDLVKEIKGSDLPRKEESVEKKASQTPKKGEKKPGVKRGKKKEAIDVDYYVNAKKEIMQKYTVAKKKFNQAVKNRDKRAKIDAKKEEKELYNKLMDLSRELRTKNNGVLPKWWVEGVAP